MNYFPKYYRLMLLSALAIFFNQEDADGQEMRKHYKIKNHYRSSTEFAIKYRMNNNWVIKKIATKRLKADLVADSNGQVRIEFWGFTGKSPELNGNDAFVNQQDSTKNFYFEVKDSPTLGFVQSYVTVPYALWQAGALSIPFKYRVSSKRRDASPDAAVDINAGIYIGRQWGRSTFYRDKAKNHNSISFTLAAFTGPTAIAITKDNVRDTTKFLSERSEIGWSIGFGTLYAYRDFSFGLLVGTDIPLSKYGRNWEYSAQPWIGIALGYQLGVFGKK